jgi:tetratricopeptide (TPR) repeat protein
MPRRQAAYGAGLRRKSLIKKVLVGLVLLVLLSLLPITYFGLLRGRDSNERRHIRVLFESGAFEGAYSQSKELLINYPLDSFLLMMHGFSAYQLAIAQINTSDTLLFVDECIWSLRKTMLSGDNSADGRIFYVLGKAYFYKGQEYMDLAVKYLEKARATYSAADIPEYLGLAYASIRDYRGSVEAFSDALSEGQPSDIMLLSIARSYAALDEEDLAKAYLYRCLEVTADSGTSAAAHILLGNVYTKTGDYSGAENEYLKAIEENGESAEVRYQLGELYAMGGDATRARAEWRRALRIDPTYGPARNRLN